MNKAAAFKALLAGAVAAPLWPGLAWAYAPSPTPPVTTGGSGAPSIVGHQGGAEDDLPPLTTTSTTPSPGSSVTVGLGGSACTQALSVSVTPPASSPTQFGPSNPAVGASGAFSVTGTAPSSAGTYVIFATCQDAAGNTYVYTVTIVVPGTPAQSGVRAAVTGGSVSDTTSGSPGAPTPAGSATGGTGPTAWAPPAGWSTPQVRALVAQAVNSAFSNPPQAVSFGAQPVVAHTAPTPAPSGAPWRDGTEALVGGLAALSLLKLNRRHRPSSRLFHRGGLFR